MLVPVKRLDAPEVAHIICQSYQKENIWFRFHFSVLHFMCKNGRSAPLNCDLFNKTVWVELHIRHLVVALSALTQMALMSDSWPVKVCRHMLSLMSHSLTEASQAPDTKVRRSGDRDRLMTSPLWPEKTVVCWLVSMSHSALGQRAQS